MFQSWYNPRTKKFKYGLNPKCVWYNMMEEEIRQGFTISNFQAVDQANLTLEETSKRPCSKDDATFALLTTISFHTITVFNEINNFPRLDAMLNGEPIGLGNCVSQQHGSNIGKVVVEEIINHSSKVKWNLPQDSTYVHCRVTSILYKIDIYATIWANKLFPLKVCHN